MKTSIIIPLYNGEHTIIETLTSLLKQDLNLIKEILIVDNLSKDDSLKKINTFFSENKKILNNIKIMIISNKNPSTAESYNIGIRNSESDFVILLHQDIIILENSLQKLVQPFMENKNIDNIAISTHCALYSFDIWKNYNFWGKCLFSRYLDKKFFGFDGKFDCINRKIINKVGLFNSKTYRTAGEDADLIKKIEKYNFEIITSNAEILHLHHLNSKFDYKNIIKKECQFGGSYGVLLRKMVLFNLKDFLLRYFRMFLIILLFVPHINIIAILLIIIYSFLYTKNVYLKEYKNLRILILPFFNIMLLFFSFFYTIKGFIYGKQKL